MNKITVLILLTLCSSLAYALENNDDIDAQLLPLNGTENARDLGGYITQDNQIVRPRLLYRADSLAALNDSDLAYLKTLNLSAVTDLRSASERIAAPDRLPLQSPPIKYSTLNINNTTVNIPELRYKIFEGRLSSSELLALTNRESYVTDPAIRREWGNWLKSLTQPDNVPHLFHCTAGKDRTGFAAAILLLTLGVSEQQVIDDFLLSNAFLADQIDKNLKTIASRSKTPLNETALRQVLGVTSSSLEGAFAAMRSSFGSIDNFIEQGLGIEQKTREKLKEIFLADLTTVSTRLTSREILETFANVRDEAALRDANRTRAVNHWYADGTFTTEWSNELSQGTVIGSWLSENNQRCVIIAEGQQNTEGQKRCSPIYRFKHRYFSLNPNGSIHAQHLLSPIGAPLHKND